METNSKVEVVPSEEPKKPRKGFGKAIMGFLEKLGRAVVPLFMTGKFGLGKQLRALPDRLRRWANQLSLLIELFDDYRSGAYRDVEFRTIAITAGAIVYVLSPIDLIPITVPFVGAVDDALVVALTMRFLRHDLEAYCRFKGYDPEEYFGTAQPKAP